MATVRDDMTLALRLADQADTLTTQRFGAMDLHVDTKPDLTPVTVSAAVRTRVDQLLITTHRRVHPD